MNNNFAFGDRMYLIMKYKVWKISYVYYYSLPDPLSLSFKKWKQVKRLLRALSALPEDRGLIPSILMIAHNCSRASDALFWPQQALRAYMM